MASSLPTRRLHVGISRSYGGIDVGDEAILEGILGELRVTPLGDVTVFSRSWDSRAELRARIREKVPALRTRARETNELLLGLLEERVAPGAPVLAEARLH
ncbi:MAG: hypothetical protein SFX73_21245 [Kofleriaceae bacterium]|nr:hypothetical protein [Kofleriaceae bacterium]